MTREQAKQALNNRTKVEGGAGADHDTGVIHAISGDMARVGWDSGVTTPCPIANLRLAQPSR